MSGAAIALKRQGLVDYQTALESQRRIHEEVAAGTRPNTLILLEHPSVYTAGRRTEAHERPIDGTPVIDVDRGGRDFFVADCDQQTFGPSGPLS